MQVFNNKLNKKEIESLNILESDVLGMDFQYINGVDYNFITVNKQRKIAFTKSLDRDKTFRKIKEYGFGRGWEKPLLTDEEKGIIQASENGENPFAFSMIANNTSLNGIYK